jgi:hypothetical protein
MIKSGRGLLYISIAVLCGFSLLVACNDADGAADARLTGGTGGEGATRGAGAAGGGAGAQALEPLTFKVEGTVCGEQVDYEAPADAVLTLVLTPSGRLQGLLIGDGPLIDINDVDAMRTYAEHHDVIANIGLEETAVLRVGSVGWASGGLSARGFGSLKLSGTDERSLEISEYEPGTRIAGSMTHDVGWFSATYPERADPSCTEGEVTLSFSGGFVPWDGRADCYSPTQNLEHISSGFALGCPCNPDVDKPICVHVCSDPDEPSGEGAACDGMAIALFCTGEQWQWGHDGPCR